MMRRWPLLAMATIWLAASGCSHLEGYLDIARERGLSAEYQATLEQWTRSQIVYSQFETKAHIVATCRSEAFNAAYRKEYGRIYRLNAEEDARQAAVGTDLAGDFSEFLFYAYIPQKTANDFDRRGSIWTIRLVNAKGEGIEPVEVRRIDPVTTIVTEFFPFVNPYYGIAYRLRFPPLPEGWRRIPLRLRFVSVLGTVELEFPAT